MLKNLYLRDVGPSREMALELAPRLNVLTGDNGLGKSFILDIAWWALTFNWGPDSSGKAWPRRGKGSAPAMAVQRIGRNGQPGSLDAKYDFEEQDWITDYASRRSDPGLIIYARWMAVSRYGIRRGD